MRTTLMLILVLAALPAANAAAQTIEIDLDTVLAWSAGGDAPAGLPTGDTTALSGDQVATTTYTDFRGNTHTISTPRNSGEDAADWAQRHKEAVDAIMEVFPVEEPEEEETQGGGR